MKPVKRFSKKWVGRKIVAITKDGANIRGKVVKVSGNKIWIKRTEKNKAHTSAIIPLVLYDLLAINGAGVPPYGPGIPPYGGYGPYGGYPGYPIGYGHGYPPGWFY